MSATGKETRANLGGKVTDAQNAVISKARITVTSVETGVKNTTETNKAGEWRGIGDPKVVYGTLHGPGYSGSGGISSHGTLPDGQADAAFHVYTVEWSPDSISFSVDDFVYVTRTPKDLPPNTTWVYDHPFYILLNFAVGGMLLGYPDSSTKFSQQMLVNYVRVFRQ